MTDFNDQLAIRPADAVIHFERLLDAPIPIDVPVSLMHGERDEDVPCSISRRLADALRSDAVQLTFVKDGNHRLSRPQDVALLLRIISGLLQDLDIA